MSVVLKAKNRIQVRCDCHDPLHLIEFERDDKMDLVWVHYHTDGPTFRDRFINALEHLVTKKPMFCGDMVVVGKKARKDLAKFLAREFQKNSTETKP